MKRFYFICDTIFFLICCYRVFTNLKAWPNYSSCAAPIQIFLVAAPSAIMIIILICHLLEARAISPRLRKSLNIFIIFILTPFCFYLSVQGVIWQMIIRQKSPSCPTGISETPWIWVFVLSLFGMVFAQEAYFIIKAYRQARRALSQLAENRYNQIAIELEEVENNKTGLLSAEIERREKGDYQQEDSIQGCAICLMEFNAEYKIVTLPKYRHVFHSECIGAWLQNKLSCPMCRGSVRNGMVSIELQAGKKNRYRPPPEIA